MSHPDPGITITAICMGIVFGFPLVVIWLGHRAKVKAIELLKWYAEKGLEPPAGLVEAISSIGKSSSPPPSPPVVLQPPRPTRAGHLSHVASNVVLAFGAAGIVWWRALQPHQNPDALMLVAIIFAVFFTAGAASRLVAALTSGDGR